MLDDEPHIPVLLDRCVELLGAALTRAGDGATLVDATLGAGGHAERFLTLFPGLHLIGLDRDPDALRIAGDRLAPFGDRVTLVRSCSISASPPCNWTGASGASPTRPTLHWTCGWTPIRN